MHIKMFAFIKSVVYIVLLKLICFQCNLKFPTCLLRIIKEFDLSAVIIIDHGGLQVTLKPMDGLPRDGIRLSMD